MFAVLGLCTIGWTGVAANAAVVQRLGLVGPVKAARPVAVAERLKPAADQGSSKATPKVKYYVVPRAGHGPSTLSEIAARTLGDAHLFTEIFKLNKGRLQPNGERLENPKLIEPGWILELPANASGPGVRFGPLPHPRPHPRSHSTPSGRASAPAKPTPASSPTGSPAKSSSAGGLVIVIVVLLAALALAVIGARMLVPRRKRHGRAAHPDRDSGADRFGWLRGFEDFLGRLDGGKVRRPWAVKAVEYERGPGEYPSGSMPAVNYEGYPLEYPSGSMPTVGYEGYSAEYPSGSMPALNYRGRPGEYPSGLMPAVDQWGRPIEYPSGQQEAVGYGNWPPEHPSRPMQAVDYQGRPPEYPNRPPEPIGYGNWPPEHPSRPMQAVDYRGWPAEHPSRPQEAVDYRGRSGQHPHQGPTNHPYQPADYSGWPRDYSADYPSRPQEAADYRGWPADYPSRPQEAVGYSVWPRPWQPGPGGPAQGRPVGPGLGQQPVAAMTGQAGPSLRERDPAPVPRHARTLPPLPVSAYRPSPQLRAEDGLRLIEESHTADWPTDALQVVSLLLTGAEGEASKIRAEAQEQATAVRAEASAEATAVRAEATVEAARLREAAERDAEAMRTSLHAMTSELSEVAAFVTSRLSTPEPLVAEPETGPSRYKGDQSEAEGGPGTAAKAGEKTRPTTTDRPGSSRPASTRPAGARPPGSRPASGRPAVEAKADTAIKPEAEPKPKTSPAPAAKPGGRSRQQRAARIMMIAFVSLFGIGTLTGTIEFFLHGAPFFVFRSAGTGATPGDGTQENQGPGQPGANHHHALVHHHPAKTHPAKNK